MKNQRFITFIIVILAKFINIFDATVNSAMYPHYYQFIDLKFENMIKYTEYIFNKINNILINNIQYLVLYDNYRLQLFNLLYNNSDINININWPLVHYKSAVRYLQQNTEDISATGGTNWQKYLPPRFQKRIFFPELWSAEEIEKWGA